MARNGLQVVPGRGNKRARGLEAEPAAAVPAGRPHSSPADPPPSTDRALLSLPGCGPSRVAADRRVPPALPEGSLRHRDGPAPANRAAGDGPSRRHRRRVPGARPRRGGPAAEAATRPAEGGAARRYRGPVPPPPGTAPCPVLRRTVPPPARRSVRVQSAPSTAAGRGPDRRTRRVAPESKAELPPCERGRAGAAA